MKNIKNKIDNIKKNIIKNITSLNKEKFVNYYKNIQIKISNLTLSDIKNFLEDNKNTIVTLIVSTLLFLLCIWLIYIGFKAYGKYKEVNKISQTIAIVSDRKIKNYIKSNKLRTIYSFSKSYAVLINKKQIDNKTFIFKVSQALLYWGLESKGLNQINLSTIKDKLFEDVPEEIRIKNSSKNKIERIILIIDNEKKLKLIFPSCYKTLIRNYKHLIESSYISSYISSFPIINISSLSKLNFIKSDKFISALHNLYIWEIIFIENELKQKYNEQKNIYEQYQEPYNKFLSIIFLPSVNIWKNPFSGKINIDIFGLKYLTVAKYIDINLIKYWSDYFTYSYKWLLYQGDKNDIQSIKVGKFKDYKWINNVNILPLSVKFWLDSDKSFYWLLSKLTSTSNIKNIMLITEFTYDLWYNVKNNLLSKLEKFKKLNSSYKNSVIWEVYLSYLLKSCLWNTNLFSLYNCKKFFWCIEWNNCTLDDILSTWEGDTIKTLVSQEKINISSLYNILFTSLSKNPKFDFKKSSFYKYYNNDYYNIKDSWTLIGALLYDCLLNDGYCRILFNSNISSRNVLYENDLIRLSIEKFANCKKNSLLNCSQNPNSKECISCKYNFINKFDSNYFIAYTMVNKLYENINWKNYSLLDRLQDVYKNIAWILELWKFTFNRIENGINLYVSNVGLNIYYKYITSNDLKDILIHIWKKCLPVSKGKPWSINIALGFITNKINTLYKLNIWADEIYDLNKIKTILENLNKQYKKADILNKVLLNLQSYRILKERGYCEK
jgi:hypothetical protein